MRKHAAQLVPHRDAVAQILKIDQPHLFAERGDQLFQLAFLYEGPRGDYALRPRAFQASENIRGAGGEIHHRRHAARRGQRQQGDAGAIGVRHHQADDFARRRMLRKLCAQHARANQQFAIAQLAANRIFQRNAGIAMFLRRVGRRLKQRAVRVGRAENEVRHDFIQRGAGGLATRLALQCIVNGQSDRLLHRQREFRKPAAAHLRLGQPREASLPVLQF